MGIHPQRPRRGISLCAGGGGLDLGLALAEPGFDTICFVEWDRAAQECLVGGMLGGDLPRLAEWGARPAAVLDGGLPAAGERRAQPFRPAPVWDDVRTFVGYGWRGHCDTILAGYPCQPFSAAGQRAGADDERHLWPDVARIIREVGPEWLYLENVAGHVSLGLETVLRDIWGMGYTPAAGLFSAAEVGAAHERLRVFIVAHRQGGRLGKRGDAPQPGRGGYADGQGGPLADSARIAQRKQDNDIRPEPRGDARRNIGGEGWGSDEALVDPDRIDASEAGPERGGQQRRAAGDHGSVADPSQRQLPQQGRGSIGGNGAGSAGPDQLGDAQQPGCEGPCIAGSDEPGKRVGPGDGSAAQSGRAPLAPPSPGERDRWADILSHRPDLAPAAGLDDCLAFARRVATIEEGPEQAAAESHVCRMADGLASRSRALKLLGNGVHPLVAGHAWRALSLAHGLRPVDLEGGDW